MKYSKKKIILIIAIILIITIPIAYFLWPKISEPIQKPTEDISGTLKIVASPWTGWSVKQPEDTISYIEIVSGKVIPLDGELQGTALVIGEYTGEYGLTIVSANEESIKLSVNGLSLKEGDRVGTSGINLQGCTQQNFTLQRGESAELNTCSMDAGTGWILTYVE